jgi:CheY-like chemotaxis protein
MINKNNLSHHVRDALAHFHDPSFLQTSPLVALLLPEGTDSVAAQLQTLLREGVECLRPSPSIPSERPEWFGYRILQCRYFELRNVHTVCDELALSPTSLYRYQQQAIGALADILWNRPQQDTVAEEGQQVPDSSTPDEQAVHEAVRLARASQRGPVDVSALMSRVSQTVEPLASQRGIPFALEVPTDLPTIYGDTAIFHQIIVNILAGVLGVGPAHDLRVQVILRGHEVIWRLVDTSWHPEFASDLLQRAEFVLGQRVLSVYGGHFWTERSDDCVESLCFALPHVRPHTILVIEDDEDTLQLYQRYLQGQGYMLRIARNGEEAWQLLTEETPPNLIILDVLMPREDGWMVLQRLKILPETADIPVIIYSVLGQPSLALALGAVRVLRKPIEEETLLTAIREALPPEDSSC